MVMQQGEKQIFYDPTKYLEDARQYRLDPDYVPPDPWEETMKALLAATVDSISELSEDIGFLSKIRPKMTDIDALGTIAKIIDLNLVMIKDYQDELKSQREAYKLG